MHVHGIDIVEIARIKAALDTWGHRFIGRIYTEAEVELCQGRPPQLASRFAGKEAVIKALGGASRGIRWQDIEILPKEDGSPSVHLDGRARSRAEEMGIGELVVSLSHSREYAIASVVGARDEDRVG